MILSSAALPVAGFLSSYFAAAAVPRPSPVRNPLWLSGRLKTFLLTFGAAPPFDMGPPGGGMSASPRLYGRDLT